MIPVYHVSVKSARISAKKLLGIKTFVEITHSGSLYSTRVSKGNHPEWGACFNLNGKATYALVKLVDKGVLSDDIIGEGLFILAKDIPNGKVEVTVPIFLYNNKVAELLLEIEHNITSKRASLEYLKISNRKTQGITENFNKIPEMKKAISTEEQTKAQNEEQKYLKKSKTSISNKLASIDVISFGIQLNDIVYEKMIYTSPSGKQQIFFGKIASIDHPVAIKVSHCENNNEFNRVQREAMAISQLSHPNICKVYSTLLDTQNNQLKNIIILEHCEGVSLRKIIEQRKVFGEWFSEQEVVSLLGQMVGAFAHIQSKGIVHSDIKPDNIVVSESGTAKVIDFGISLHSYVDVFDTARTMKVGGTVLYFSPLQIQAYLSYIQGMNPNCIVKHSPLKSDVFSLGLSFIHVSTLSPPIGLNNFDQTLSEKLSNVIGGIRYSQFVKRVLEQMLIIDENMRPDFVTLNKLISGLNH